MAVRRTPDEIVDIVNHCVELEKTGGDILGYLWSQDYLTPRATWFNFQREWLGRKPYEYTDGKPGKGGNMVKRVYLSDAQKEEAVRLAIEGKDPKAYLEGLGVGDPAQMWGRIKEKLKEKRPEIYAKIPARVGKPGPKAADQPAVLKVDGPLKIETPESNLVNVVETPEKPVISKPLVYQGMTVCAINGVFGRYEYYKTGSGQYIDFEHKDIDDTISMTIEQWRDFFDEFKHAAAILGVEL